MGQRELWKAKARSGGCENAPALESGGDLRSCDRGQRGAVELGAKNCRDSQRRTQWLGERENAVSRRALGGARQAGCEIRPGAHRVHFPASPAAIEDPARGEIAQGLLELTGNS